MRLRNSIPSLPDDVEALRAIVRAQQAEIAGQRKLIGQPCQH